MKKLKLISTILGLILLLFTTWQIVNTIKFTASAQHTEGTVVKLIEKYSQDNGKDKIFYYPQLTFIDSHHTPQLIESASGSNPAHYSVGEKVPIIYQIDNPENAKIDTFFELWAGAIITGIFAVVFMLPLIISRFITRLSGNKVKKLQHNGTPVKAKITSIEQNQTITINGRNPWQIVCQWHNMQENRVYVFNSQNIWFNPAEYISCEELTVFIDKSNPKKYWVDITFLPSKA
ncbi:DUF3592 domain-containing protein [Rahnella sp. SAP-1]|uniref:DUF3592 domain-containing protein n=1 Tax=Rouxiella aceris TaxID=2703884 RepID=A0A848MRB5_9GAMM|nr:DUF3592 domain-containing protein [Rouxiella aceris]NMP29636.1 DUF3592 domain-containing protein [Rouxiella aceris]